MNLKTKTVWKSIAIFLLLVWALITIIPLYWMMIGSFQDSLSSATYDPQMIPSVWSVAPYERFFNQTMALRWLLNSVIVAGVITITNVFFASLAGYAFAKLKFPGRNTIFWVLLSTMMIPSQVTLIPLYILMINVFELGDTYTAIILPSIVTVGNIFLMKQYMSTLPTSLIHAARIDACSEFRIFYKIILPMAKPGLAVLAIFTFVAQWNEFFWPFLVTKTSEMRTIQVGLASFKFAQSTDYGAIMAGATIGALPMIILFFGLQRYFLQGITIGAVKG
ncbi:L-arabinose transport system permease protein AraQ [Paenibacillus larvae subsp. larvae]|uniref:L-arabinose transport system permease protein AraQ n=1 Tax=Paenibacillus larvae subsp. larvae TaxID=147375 RepID=A0A2L1TVB0_9BACL|nr:carbohydrate ABC transporter permease [Paenibacillus larvae]AQT85309.1 sugar ABC transporter permease [Paenibacillus larvae subsp. pulvifaciens]AQZ47315.1 sugar ABC transporter permease [Paenibacillus larvae subsp. pulvifaciens]AVF24620.1 L-arabinose transport system permease protein AraQ [Paenibacillus larvae subsp. larvae]AVF29381.1 L-arabinose transport system permease protein AraQ [Paenibacillus larvae subsp. larvae]MBH0343174.1 sugar ABC transporter permease [Paenibacillus larvae]